LDDLEEGEDEAMDDDEGAYDDEVDDEELLAKKKTLDLMIEYLRRVYNFCFFCVFESDSVHELTRKCPGGHLRRPRSSLTTAANNTARATAAGLPFPYKKADSSGDVDMDEGAEEERKTPKLSVKIQQQLQRAFNWVKTYEDKLLQILEPENADLKKLGGKPPEEGLEEELAKFVKQEDENKWRCKAPIPECTKLFKGHNFWRKHVDKRHSEWLEKLKRDVSFRIAKSMGTQLILFQIELVNTYVLDPAHIAPSRSDANSNGHFPMGNHGNAGTPRGFTLANMTFNMPGTGNGMPPFQPFFNPAMGTWPQGIADDGGHQSGPMRRSGGRYNSRSGPYDRQQRDGRTGRYNNSNNNNNGNTNNGRLTPPRGVRTGGARFGEGGPGPLQSVLGRQLKSYEDLDAVASSGGGELDY